MKTDKIPEEYKDELAKPNENLYEHTYNLLKNLDELKPYLSESEISLLEYCCIYHDIGKINSAFQNRVKSNGKIKFDSNNEVGHNILSFLYVANNRETIPNDVDEQLAFHIILNHHNYVDNLEEVNENLELKKKVYEDCFYRIGNDEFPILQIKNRLKKRLFELRDNPEARQIVLKGFFHKCDYAASAHIPIDIKNDNLRKRLESLKYQWNDMQMFSMAHSEDNIIIIGSTGLGKTEASLLWQGNDKGFYVLPIRTAINAMYDRLKNQLYKNDYKKQLGVLHGNTQDIYISDDNNRNPDAFWEYFERTRKKAYPLTVCTPDQIFKFIFKGNGYEADLATLSYSKIIIDEIQAYSPDILASIIYGLQRINEVGGKFAITTATLAPFIKDLLTEDFNDLPGKSKKYNISFSEGYFPNPIVRHKVTIRYTQINSGDVINLYNKQIDAESSKVLVVVNTVKKAHELYSEISNELGRDCVKLLHSKFIAKDRKRLESLISEDGKTDVKKHVVWIATQVVEASLDIDFDYLFTEFSDLSGFFQRMGRCNRKGLKSTENSNIFVYLEIPSYLMCMKKPEKGTEKNGFIYQSLYELGINAIKNWESNSKNMLMSENDKAQMINEFYTKEKIYEFEKDTMYASYLLDYRNRYDELKIITPGDKKFNEKMVNFRNILTEQAIPYSVYLQKMKTIEIVTNKIQSLLEEIRSSSDEKNKIQLRIRILKLKNIIKRYTLSARLHEISYNKKNGGYFELGYEKIYIMRDTYKYNLNEGIYRDDREEEAIFW